MILGAEFALRSAKLRSEIDVKRILGSAHQGIARKETSEERQRSGGIHWPSPTSTELPEVIRQLQTSRKRRNACISGVQGCMETFSTYMRRGPVVVAVGVVVDGREWSECARLVSEELPDLGISEIAELELAVSDVVGMTTHRGI